MYIQYIKLLKGPWLHVRKEKLLSSVWGCKRGIAQGKLPHGLKFFAIQVHFKNSTFFHLFSININISILSISNYIWAVKIVDILNFIQQEVRRLKEGVKGGCHKYLEFMKIEELNNVKLVSF